MAGEDPGVGTLSVVLDLIKQAGSTVTGAIKNGISFGLDVIKTGMFFAWRRQMMQSQKGPDLVHGKQSLKKLRLHEQVGAEIVSVNIGDREAMKALDAELKRLKIDYAITSDNGKDKTYTLHYKKSNELDVLIAQANAMQQLYGVPEKDVPEVEQAEQGQPDRQVDAEREERQQLETQEEQARQQQEQQRETQENQGQEQTQQQEREAQEQQQSQQGREQDEPRQQEAASAPEQVQPEGADHERGRADQRESIGAAAAGRTASQPLTVAGAAKAVPVDELQQKLGEMRSRSSQGRGVSEQTAQRLQQVLEGRGEHVANRSSLHRSAPIHSRDASLDELKQQARERARTKNLARKARDRDITRSRSMNRGRNRGLELGH